MKTQIEVQTEIQTFTTQIQSWASATGNSKAYISRAVYLTTGESKYAYNIALSQLKKQVKAQIAETRATAQATATARATAKTEINAEKHTKLQLRIMARDLGLTMTGTKIQIAERINNQV